MFKVKGRLSNNKAFAFDSQANALSEAFNDMGKKLQGKVPAGVEITACSFLKRGAILSDIVMSDVKKRATKDKETTKK